MVPKHYYYSHFQIQMFFLINAKNLFLILIHVFLNLINLIKFNHYHQKIYFFLVFRNILLLLLVSFMVIQPSMVMQEFTIIFIEYFFFSNLFKQLNHIILLIFNHFSFQFLYYLHLIQLILILIQFIIYPHYLYHLMF